MDVVCTSVANEYPAKSTETSPARQTGTTIGVKRCGIFRSSQSRSLPLPIHGAGEVCGFGETGEQADENDDEDQGDQTWLPLEHLGVLPGRCADSKSPSRACPSHHPYG